MRDRGRELYVSECVLYDSSTIDHRDGCQRSGEVLQSP